MFQQKIVFKFLFQVFLDNLKTAFEQGLFFKLLYYLIPNALEFFKPYKHEKLSLLLETPVILGSPYFKAIEVNTISLNWYKVLI